MEDNEVENSYNAEDYTPQATPDFVPEEVEEKEEEETSTEESTETNSEESDAGEETEDEHKPWQTKKREKHTPSPALQQRFRDLTGKLKQRDESIAAYEARIKAMEDMLGVNKPKTRDDFPDEESYFDYRAEQIAEKRLNEYKEQTTHSREAESKRRQIESAYANNLSTAMNDLADYDAVIQNGDPDLTLPDNVYEHLMQSPAGPYVLYKLADDPEFSNAVKFGDTRTKHNLIANLHNQILESLNARSATPATPAEPVVQNPAPQTAPVAKKKQPPKAPPSTKSGKNTNLYALDGDDFAKAYLSGKR